MVRVEGRGGAPLLLLWMRKGGLLGGRDLGFAWRVRQRLGLLLLLLLLGQFGGFGRRSDGVGVVGAELLVRFWVDGYDVRRCLGGSRGGGGQLGGVFLEKRAIVGVAAALGA